MQQEPAVRSKLFPSWGRVLYRYRRVAAISAAMLMAATLALVARGGTLSSRTITEGESVRAQALMDADLQHVGLSSFDLIYTSQTLTARDPRFRQDLRASLTRLTRDPRVRAVVTPYSPAIPSTEASALISRDGRAALVVVDVADVVDTARGYFPALRALVRPRQLSIVATGPAAIDWQFYDLLSQDLKRGESVSIPITLLLLLIVFGTVVAAVLPLGVGVCAVLGGVGAVYLLSRSIETSQYALNIVTLIGLGVTIDYSLFLVSRFRQELRQGHTVEDALAVTMFTAGRSVLFSGLTVAIGLSGLFFFTGTPLPTMGFAGTCVVLFALMYALVLLPALLAMLGTRVDRWHLPTRRLLRRSSDGRAFWFALADWVMRHPVRVLGGATLVIVLVGSPFLAIKLAVSDTSVLPHSAETYEGLQILAKRFPAQGQTAIPVVVQFDDGRPLRPANVGALFDLSRRLAVLPGAAHVTGPVDVIAGLGRVGYEQLYRRPLPPNLQAVVRHSVGRDIAVLTVASVLPVHSDGAHALVRAIRTLPPPPGSQVLVGGRSAEDIDELKLILDRVPWAMGYVVVTILIVLFFLLGSALLPFKAILANMLSITASFGALVWIFQQGHLTEQLGFSPVPIDPIVPVLLFCVLFGLSMDYEVLMLTRIKEMWDRTGDNRQAVKEGLGQTGRLITGAAAIMVTVFLAFALASVVVLKSLGLGMAIAVVLDATIVRTLIVPATMRLLGRANWWAPHPLAYYHHRVHLHLGLHHSHWPVRPPADHAVPAASLAASGAGRPAAKQEARS